MPQSSAHPLRCDSRPLRDRRSEGYGRQPYARTFPKRRLAIATRISHPFPVARPGGMRLPTNESILLSRDWVFIDYRCNKASLGAWSRLAAKHKGGLLGVTNELVYAVSSVSIF
jgi:hypothetical protein